MFRCLPLLVVVLVSTAAVSAPAPREKSKFLFVDLQPNGNRELKKSLGSFEENTLAILKEGERTLDDVRFNIGARLMHLGSKSRMDDPEKIEGIKVEKKCLKMHILHATQYGRGPNVNDSGRYEKDGAVIGEYKVNYADKTSVSIEIVYGRDVRDWWYVDDEKDTIRSKIAWSGENEASKKLGSKIRLYQTIWTNLHPDKTIASIDYISRKSMTACAPFCLAITLEEK